jgi:hypothetical protein
MARSYRYDPDSEQSTYDRKVKANNRRRTRQVTLKDKTSRQVEFNTGVNSAGDNAYYDSYGDYDYSRYISNNFTLVS